VKAARRLFYITFVIALMFEALPYSNDTLAVIGVTFHEDIKKWLPVSVPLSLLEVLLLTAAALWLFRGARERRAVRYDPGHLALPVAAFGAAVAFGVVWGLLRGGANLTYALFEIRGLGTLIFAYLLVGMLLRDERDLRNLIWCVLIACAGLAAQNVFRFYTEFGGSLTTDLAYEHDDSLILAFGAILCLAVLAFKGSSRAQRRVSLALFPFILLCLALMQRRAAWPVLFFGLVVLAIVLLRLRPKTFWRVVPVVSLLVAGYLAIYWNQTGTLGQPARAIRSQIAPDPRDASSNQYRLIEHYDIVANIRTARVMGLGFGQPYAFYIPLPDLSYWIFWHYESHNSVLWLWMDGGIPVFFTFLWLAGSALATGGQELSTQREIWFPPRLSRWRRAHQRADATSATHDTRSHWIPGSRSVAARTRASGGGVTISKGAAGGASAAATAQRTNTVTIVFAASLCFIVMQLLYSWVDLGLINPRDMLLFGTALGIAGRAFPAGSARLSRQPRGGDPRAARSAPSSASDRPVEMAAAGG
jgi:hypothetical protein